MVDFIKNLTEGIQHITDPGGYDHMLFLLALCAPFHYSEWKRIILLATAFTVGHSLTLALSAMDILRFSSDIIELLIPITIVITAVGNLLGSRSIGDSLRPWQYILATAFGLIHGMGFSTYFKMMYDEASSRALALLAFNLGVELGQVLIISLLFLIMWAVFSVFKTHIQRWGRTLSVLALLLSVHLIVMLLFFE